MKTKLKKFRSEYDLTTDPNVKGFYDFPLKGIGEDGIECPFCVRTEHIHDGMYWHIITSHIGQFIDSVTVTQHPTQKQIEQDVARIKTFCKYLLEGKTWYGQTETEIKNA